MHWRDHCDFHVDIPLILQFLGPSKWIQNEIKLKFKTTTGKYSRIKMFDNM